MSSLNTYTLRRNIIEMGCGHGARDNFMSPTMKWTGSLLYKMRLTTDQRTFSNGGENKSYFKLINPEGLRYQPS